MSGLAVAARQLVHIYRLEGHDVVALTGVDLDVAPGQLVGVLGPSGAGKSTLLRLLAALQRPSAGRLRLGEHDLGAIAGRDLDRVRARDVGVVLQGAEQNLLPYATPEQNIAFAQRPARRLGHRELPAAGDVLDLVGLAQLARRPLSGLTPGERQRLAVGVAIAASPGLLLADEPTSRLDHAYRDEVLDALVNVNAQRGTTIVAVTHDPAVAARFERTITIRDGRIGAEGRRGREFAVLGADGSLQLPPLVRDQIPAGTLLEVEVDDHAVITIRSVPE